jgi:hypothetical protein
MAASYASSDGRDIWPGVARLAVDCGVSLSTAKRALRELRLAGLLEVSEARNRRRGQTDVYHLVVPAAGVPSDEDHRAVIEAVRAKHLEASRDPREDVAGVEHQGSPVTPDATDQGSPVTPKAEVQVSNGGLSGVTGDTPPSIDPYARTSRGYRDARFAAGDPDARVRANARTPLLADHLGGESTQADARPRDDIPVCGEDGTWLDPDGSCYECRTAGRCSA